MADESGALGVVEPGSEPLADERYERFCLQLLIDPRAPAAYAAAGFQATGHALQVNPYRLLGNPLVKARATWLRQQRAEQMGVTIDYVIDVVVDVIEACRPQKDAQGTITKKGNPALALRGAELLGRHLGAFLDKVEVTDGDVKAVVSKALARMQAARAQETARADSAGG